MSIANCASAQTERLPMATVPARAFTENPLCPQGYLPHPAWSNTMRYGSHRYKYENGGILFPGPRLRREQARAGASRCESVGVPEVSPLHHLRIRSPNCCDGRRPDYVEGAKHNSPSSAPPTAPPPFSGNTTHHTDAVVVVIVIVIDVSVPPSIPH